MAKIWNFRHCRDSCAYLRCIMRVFFCCPCNKKEASISKRLWKILLRELPEHALDLLRVGKLLIQWPPRILVNWRLFSLAGRAGVPKPAAIQLTLPMIFFAWKRMCYVLMLPINTDDNPHGHYLMIPGSITFMLWLNLSNGCASIGAETWPDVANFVCIDWLLFFLRIGMCKRFGAKTCPGLFNALLSLP